MESTREAFWAIARIHRDRAWDAQRAIAYSDPDWSPEMAGDHDDVPLTDGEMWWYLQGKAEAYASIMSEIESAR